ncbi:DUF1349 domain-containing protein [Paenibacillus sp. JX-17]|uniref:DUF1349 domain-containing protein n=1 Tax=Paenibacillus lacisoli TaxID=3064525 RepID=A0ABT9C8A3_9BACL|nr:DUF1349 domain-containing protein [Paenibacillus sp. JX-17]MDO7904838.1 DUF1349 domain-containing protein [Paenibacillus sp. JX-17]
MENIVNWQKGTWTVQPEKVELTEDGMIVQAAEGSDYWEETMYGFKHDNGHALLSSWEDNSAVEVSFKLDTFTELYDQAGLMLWKGTQQWIKAGIEINDGQPNLAVVVTNGCSDWSLSPVPDWKGQQVTIRASQMNDAVIIRAAGEDGHWRTIRVARFTREPGRQAGPFTCGPTRAGLRVLFTRWVHTAPDKDIHEDPPFLATAHK